MPNFHIKWAVSEAVNGEDFDGGRRHGHQSVVASGEVDKEGPSAEALRAELTDALKGPFPTHSMGGTFEIDRTYNIDITPL